MKKISVFTDKAPQPVGPYSQAVVCHGLLFASGQIPIDPQTGKLVSASIEEETRQILINISALLAAKNISFDHVVKTTIFLKDMKDFQAVNKIYGEFFKQPYPARSTVEVSALPLGARIEIECLAQVLS